MSVKTILVAHRAAAVRDRFATALAEAQHAYVLAGTAEEAVEAAGRRRAPVHLSILDLGLAPDGVALVRAIRAAAGRELPVVVFSGTVSGARQVQALTAIPVASYVNEHATTAQILPALAPHLFPDSFNRRAGPRSVLGVPVSVRAGRSISGAMTLDLGRGGVAVRTMNPLPKGTAVSVSFRLPGRTLDVEASGRVAWSDRKLGMGIQFERVPPTGLGMIESFLGVRS
jgi:CheY-like chemotaxis protein